jgi:hypothetical protein
VTLNVFTQRRRRNPPPATTNAHIHFCDRNLEEAEVLAWTPKNINKLRGKKVYWNPNDFFCSSVSKVWNPLPTHFRQLPICVPPISRPFTKLTFHFLVHFYSFVACRASKRVFQGGTRLLWVTGDKLMLVSKFRIWDPIKPLVNFRKCFIFCAAEC